MKKHVLWLALAVALFVIGTGYLLRRKSPPPAPAREVGAKSPSASPYAPPPNQAEPPKAKIEIPILHGKTIDFSSGVAIVKDNANEKAIIERSVKEINAALQNVSFDPLPAQKQKAEPAKAPPK